MVALHVGDPHAADDAVVVELVTDPVGGIRGERDAQAQVGGVGRIEDLRKVATIVKDKKIASHVQAMIVPGSGLVKKQAEEEGLDTILKDAGFEWREAGCSMCLGMNPDQLKPGERCASTSNRNFEGRQGRGGRTHLMSPELAAASAIKGNIADIRDFS